MFRLCLGLSLATLLTSTVCGQERILLKPSQDTGFEADETSRARQQRDLERAGAQAVAGKHLASLRDEVRESTKAFLAGMTTVAMPLDAATRHQDAQVHGPAENRLPGSEASWRFALQTLWSSEAKYDAGQISAGDLYQCRQHFQEASLAVKAARGAMKEGREPAGNVLFPAWLESSPEDQRRARALRQVELAQAEDLTRLQVDAVVEETRARFEEFLAGRKTIDAVHEAARHHVRAQAAAHPPEGRLPASEARWRIAFETLRSSEAQYEAGMISSGDLYPCRQHFHNASLAVKEARGAMKKGRDPAGVVLLLDWFEFGDPSGVPERALLWARHGFGPDDQERARSLRQVEVGRAEDLVRLRADAAAEQIRARGEEFLAGRRAFGVLIAPIASQRETELALATNRRQRLAVLEVSAEWSWAIYQSAKAKYDAGQISEGYLALSRTQWLEANLLLLREK